MDKLNLLKLTKDSYRLTLMFPKREPLRCKIREAADDILAGLIMDKKNDIGAVDGQFEVIDSFFEVAREQNWVAAQLIDDIKSGYAALRSELPNLAAPEAEPVSQPAVQKPREEPAATEKVICVPAAAVPSLIGHAAAAEVFKTPKPNPANMPEDEEVGDDEGTSEKEDLTEGQAIRQNRIVEYLKEKGQAQVWEIQKIFPDISKRTIRRDFRSLLKQGLIERVGERNRTYYKMKVNIA